MREGEREEGGRGRGRSEGGERKVGVRDEGEYDYTTRVVECMRLWNKQYR